MQGTTPTSAREHGEGSGPPRSRRAPEAPPYRPLPAGPDAPRHLYTRKHGKPHGVRWYGVGSFWGHLQHFVASAIATGDIDSRDWMRPDEPTDLADRIATALGADPSGASVTESLGRDLWIDFLADTGDDAGVSEAVARLFAASYELPDPEVPGAMLVAPRGDIYLSGGDTAYPVATTQEIHDRLIVPLNRVLVERRDGARRVLIGIPGNHDWYGGLDGFGRMFRRRIGEVSQEEDRPSLVPDRRRQIGHVVEWAEKFVAGKSVSQRKALVLDGYVPVQDASYFALPLSPGITLFAADRQLRTIDYRQRTYFTRVRRAREEDALVVLLPDPVYAYLEPNPAGVAMVEALDIGLSDRPHLVVAGDPHQYQRLEQHPTTHVTAGGGGAFLHSARIPRHGVPTPAAEWPGPIASRALLELVPWHVALGRAGLLPHLLMLIFFAPTVGVGVSFWGTLGVEWAAALSATIGSIVCAFVAGWRRGRFLRIAALATATGIVMALVPTLTAMAVSWALSSFGVRLGPMPHAALVLLLAIWNGALAFGAYLVSLTLTGLESSQALTALGHPSHKHFVRMRVRKDGSAIDLWCLGLLDPLADGEKPVLVDHFTWRPAAPARDQSVTPPRAVP